MEDLFDEVTATVETEDNKQQDVAKETTQESKSEDKQEKWRDGFFKEKQAREALAAENKKYKDAFKALGIEDDPEAAVLKHKAEKTGQTEDEIRAEIERYKAQGKEEAKAELQAQEEQKAIRLKDLEDIKAKFPDCKASDTLELGQEFIDLMRLGRYSAVEAYGIVNRNKPEKKATVSTGSTESHGSPNEKTFFTAEEIRQMSPEDERKYHDIIMATMDKWSK